MIATTELYPTRLEQLERPYITRYDPVVYREQGDTIGGPLDEDQLTHFEEKGYLQFKGLLRDQLENLRRAADALKHIDPSDERIVREPSGDTIRSIFAVHQLHDTMAQLAVGEMLAPIARQILGGSVYLHQTRINYKPGFEGKEFYWHSDFETWHSEDGMPRMRALSCAIALDDNGAHNGPLMIIPGSHKLFIACQGETPEQNYKRSLRKQDIGVPSREALTMMADKWGVDTMIGEAGSVVFFDCNAMHGSAGNITPCPRSNLFFVFNHVDNALVAPYCGRDPRPEYIGHREHLLKAEC